MKRSSIEKPSAVEERVELHWEQYKWLERDIAAIVAPDVPNTLEDQFLSKIQLDVDDWRMFHDSGVCVIVVDGKLAHLYRNLLAADIMSTKNTWYQELFAILPEDVLDQLCKRDNNSFLHFINKQISVSGPGDYNQQLKSLQHWKERHNKQEKEEFMRRMLSISLNKIRRLVTTFPSYRWTANLAKLAIDQPLDTDLTIDGTPAVDHLVASAFTDAKVVKALKFSTMADILRQSALNLSKLIIAAQRCTTRSSQHGTRSELNALAEMLRKRRNAVMHFKGRLQFDTSGERNTFLKDYEKFIKMFDFDNCFPLMTSNAEMIYEYLKPSTEFVIFQDILSYYVRYADEYKKQCQEISELKSDTSDCMSQLKDCYKKLDEKRKTTPRQ